MANVRFCSSCGSKMDVRDQFCINCKSKKRVVRMKKRYKKQRQAQNLWISAFSKRETRERIIRQRAKQLVLTKENPCLGEILKPLMVVLQLK